MSSVLEKRKRGRPKGARNLNNRAKPSALLHVESCESELPAQTLSDTHSFTMLKVKNMSVRADEKLTLLQCHNMRIAHLANSNDISSEDIEYMSKASKHLLKYTESQTKGSLLQDYINDCFNVEYRGNVDAVHELYTKLQPYLINQSSWVLNDELSDCCQAQCHIDTSRATSSCLACGMVSYYHEVKMSDIWAEERGHVLSKVAYKRVNHFREWLNSIQGRQQVSAVLQNVIEKVERELKKERVVDMSKVTPAKIRQYLHTLRLGKYYEFTSVIYTTITNNPIPHFDSNIEQLLMQMFSAIQPVFDEMEKKRKNFLSYSYTLHKMAQILNHNTILDFFPLLKSREKLHLQDKVWKRICTQMQWPFHASI